MDIGRGIYLFIKEKSFVTNEKGGKWLLTTGMGVKVILLLNKNVFNIIFGQ